MSYPIVCILAAFAFFTLAAASLSTAELWGKVGEVKVFRFWSAVGRFAFFVSLFFACAWVVFLVSSWF